MVNQVKISLEIESIDQLQLIFGPNDSNIKVLECAYNIKIIQRENKIEVLDCNDEKLCDKIRNIFGVIFKLVKQGYNIDEKMIVEIIALEKAGELEYIFDLHNYVIGKTRSGKTISPKTIGQLIYAKALNESDIVFGIGPAGTGKTYIAVAHAVTLYRANQVKKIILTRPAVEAGENLGFLPGDLKEKIDPYLRPLYDSLDDLLGSDMVAKLIEKGVIEIVPLAYMRGRTLDDAYIILDEAQNSTMMQLKMFLTRLGFNAKMAITGDITQIDLSKNIKSGLATAQGILGEIKDIKFIMLSSKDVVRHPLVQAIIDAYENAGF